MHPTKAAFKQNLIALIERDSGPLRPNETGVTRLVKKGFANGTAQRLLNDTDIGIELTPEVAVKFKVEPWALLVKDLDANQLPSLVGDSTAWPFEMVDKDAYRGMGSEERIFVQGQIQRVIAEYAEHLSRKRRAA